jgi:hypothetical protein
LEKSMDNVWKTFRAAKLGSTAAWALGVTALASVIGANPARAIVVSCPTDPITTVGGSTPETAPDIGVVCEGASISGSQTFPGYWEFTWDGSNNPAAIGASVTQNADVGSFFGDVALYDSSDNLLASATMSGSFSDDDPATGTLDYTMTSGTQYIVGIETAVTEPPFSVTFSSAPEPASIGLFGGALAALGWFRKRRKHLG